MLLTAKVGSADTLRGEESAFSQVRSGWLKRRYSKTLASDTELEWPSYNNSLLNLKIEYNFKEQEI